MERVRAIYGRHWAVVLAVLLSGSAAFGLAQSNRVDDSAETSQIRSQARAVIAAPALGDWDAISKRRIIRLLTPYNRTHYFIDKGVPRGLVHDAGIKLEDEINRRLRTTNATRIHVVVVPTARDQLFQALSQGLGDVIAPGIPIRPESRAR